MGMPATTSTRRKTHVKFVDAGDLLPGASVVLVKTLRGDDLGEIQFYKPWRQHVFVPEWGTEFSFDCLEDIAAKVKAMNEARA